MIRNEVVNWAEKKHTIFNKLWTIRWWQSGSTWCVTLFFAADDVNDPYYINCHNKAQNNKQLHNFVWFGDKNLKKIF